MSLIILVVGILHSQSIVSVSSLGNTGYTKNTHGYDKEMASIVDTLRVPIDLYSVANMYIYPHGDPLATFIIYGTPSSGTLDLVGDGYSFDYACNTSSRAYYSIPILDGHAGYSLNSVTFKIFQANCYGNFESHTFPIWHDGEPYFMMLAHVQYDLPFTGSSYFPDFVENIGVLSDNSAVGWRELDVTNAYNHAISNGWQNFQLMLYFEILTDWDYATDRVLLPNPNYTLYAPHLIVTYNKDVSIDDPATPAPIALSIKTYPQPFLEDITILPSSKNTGDIELGIYNLKGQLVQSQSLRPDQAMVWDGKDANGRACSPGVYFVKASQGRSSVSSKIVKLK